MTDTANIIEALELLLLKPVVRSSREELDRLLAEDFFEFGTSGKTYTKTDILKRLPNETSEIEYIVSNFRVDIPSENTAITTFKTTMSVEGQNPITSQRISHWRNESGTWRMFFHKSTPVD